MTVGVDQIVVFMGSYGLFASFFQNGLLWLVLIALWMVGTCGELVGRL